MIVTNIHFILVHSQTVRIHTVTKLRRNFRFNCCKEFQDADYLLFTACLLSVRPGQLTLRKPIIRSFAKVWFRKGSMLFTKKPTPKSRLLHFIQVNSGS